MMLEIKDLTLGYDSDPMLVGGVSLTANGGELIGLVGRNGVGKSTLLRAIAATQRPRGGDVLLGGESVFDMQADELARCVSFVSTGAVGVAHLLVREVVAMGRAPYTGWLGRLGDEDRRVVAHSLDLVGMSHFADKEITRLSDGERGRVMIARALAQDTPIMLLDEPTAFLDMPNRYLVEMLLGQLAHATGKTVIFSTHDLSSALGLCDSMWVLAPEGVSCGTPDELIARGAFDVIFRGTPLRMEGDRVVFESGYKR